MGMRYILNANLTDESTGSVYPLMRETPETSLPITLESQGALIFSLGGRGTSDHDKVLCSL